MRTTKKGHAPGGVEIITASPAGHEELSTAEGKRLAPKHEPEPKKTIAHGEKRIDETNPKHPGKP